MKSISINKKKLQKIGMLTEPYSPGTISYLRYPKNRIKFNYNNDILVLFVPPMLAIELYRLGLIPQNENEKFSVEVSGKKIGTFKVIDFRYPKSTTDELVKITMQK
jgi:hypothetical protein